ncbi:MAG: hypothetical protein U1E70_26210 [Acetobacteraceae bacterium]|nr:hypothetical protein [Pseudomonadota bacterium]
MFFIPTWITNLLFLFSFYLSLFQHVRMREMKPTFNLQFFMAVFSLLMVLVVLFENRRAPWLSLAFLAIAVTCLGVLYSQMKYLPPKKRYD